MFYAIANIVESGVKHQLEHDDQFYWCLTTLSIMCQVQRKTW
jgi:hypothetical protein